MKYPTITEIENRKTEVNEQLNILEKQRDKIVEMTTLLWSELEVLDKISSLRLKEMETRNII